MDISELKRTQTEQRLYQNIFDYIQGIIPDKWEKIIFLAIYQEGCYSMNFYIQNTDGIYIDCHNLKGIGSIEIIRIFSELNNYITEVRNKLDKNEKWSTMTLIIDSDGKLRVEYDYDDISERFLMYEAEWRKRYL